MKMAISIAIKTIIYRDIYRMKIYNVVLTTNSSNMGFDFRKTFNLITLKWNLWLFFSFTELCTELTAFFSSSPISIQTQLATS